MSEGWWTLYDYSFYFQVHKMVKSYVPTQGKLFVVFVSLCVYFFPNSAQLPDNLNNFSLLYRISIQKVELIRSIRL